MNFTAAACLNIQGGPKKCYQFCTFVTGVFINQFLNDFLNSINKEWNFLSIANISTSIVVERDG